jgi:hypothetical protein
VSRETVDFARAIGLDLEPWQERLLLAGYRLVPHGRRGYRWVWDPPRAERSE